MNTFSPSEAIKFGWKTFKTNPGFCIGMLAILILPSIILGIIFPSPKIDSSNLQDFSFSTLGSSMLTGFISSIISAIVTLGVIKALLIFVETNKGNFADILIPLKQTKILINYILAFVLIYAVVIVALPVVILIGIFTLFIGFLVMIPIGIYVNLRLSLFVYYLIDKAVNPLEAFSMSWKATKGNVTNLIVFGFLSFLVIIAGALALLVGLLVAVPVVMLAGIYVYKMLSQEAASTAASTPAPSESIAPPTATPPVASGT